MSDKYTKEQVRRFGKTLEREIAKYPKFVESKKKDLLGIQTIQVNRLFELEEEFRNTIRKHPRGLEVYNAFVEFIRDDRKNILHARPYFRERSDVFTNKISPALKARDAKKLMSFKVNYRLIDFIVNYRKWPLKIKKINELIVQQRNEICVTNMPLAMSRARIFFSKTPESHLSYQDFTQIAAEGLLAAIDKFGPPFTQGFRGVVIGRIVGNCISEYSHTLLHFYPGDKQKLYRGNKAARHANGDLGVLASEVNKGLEKKDQTTPDEIAQLMAANSHVSTEITIERADSKVHGKPSTLGESLPADDHWRPDVKVERQEQFLRLYDGITKLSVFEQKLLKIKGVF